MRAAVLLCLLLALVACGSKGGGGAPMCRRSPTLDDGRPEACRGGRSVVACVRPDGRGCVCTTEGRSCPACDPSQGSVCQDQCVPGEYAVTCGGGGGPPPDGGVVVVVYDDPPPGCRLIDVPGLPSSYCCPCRD